ncbi:hypothetical protein TNCV_4067051 [Trichonephila clavipes]|nr:hypothetical protein TNCV_4067051 [Trichonephila clavipes]
MKSTGHFFADPICRLRQDWIRNKSLMTTATTVIENTISRQLIPLPETPWTLNYNKGLFLHFNNIKDSDTFDMGLRVY